MSHCKWELVSIPALRLPERLHVLEPFGDHLILENLRPSVKPGGRAKVEFLVLVPLRLLVPEPTLDEDGASDASDTGFKSVFHITIEYSACFLSGNRRGGAGQKSQRLKNQAFGWHHSRVGKREDNHTHRHRKHRRQRQDQRTRQQARCHRRADRFPY